MAKTAAQKKAEKEVAKEKEVVSKEFTVTQEYMDAHPEIKENGIAVGDIIELDENEVVGEEEESDEKETKAAKGSKGAMAVLANGNEYIRTYGADQKDELKEFVSKDSKYSAVPDESVQALEVPYQVKDKTTGVINHTSRTFTDKAEAIAFRNEQRSICKVVSIK